MFDGSGCQARILKRSVAGLIVSGFLLASIAPDAMHAAEVNQKPARASMPATPEWGTYLKPFAANSLWNSRPVAPVLGDFVIPRSNYYPKVGEGIWSLGVFLGTTSDGPVTVTGLPGAKGLWDPDAEVFRDDITIPRWPRDATPAEGTDGHADIVDAVSGIVHSFHKLRYLDHKWVASHYAWARIDGSGWGDPAHYFQGARAAGVPSMAGLIRKHEVDDGESIYRHALAVSLTFNALSATPGYVFPATSADGNAAKTNFGKIPEGVLLMLPASFDAQHISHPALRKVVETLKVYGAYVVDRNIGTPFYIYVENGSGFNLHGSVWNNAVAADLDRIRQELRQVISTGGWIDANGHAFVPDKNLNLLSMRGPWRILTGSTPGIFDTWAQAVVFPETAIRTVQVNTTFRNMNPVSWAVPKSGKSYRLTATASGGAKLRFVLRDRATGKVAVDSRELENGETVVLVWPGQPVSLEVQAISGSGQPSAVRGELFAIER